MLKQAVKKIANRLGYQITKVSDLPLDPPPVDLPFIDLLDLIVQDYRQQNPDLFVLQIGAHDGAAADPVNRLIRKHQWRGILVEPQPQVFKALVETYQDQPQLIFENAAIGDQEGKIPFYSVSPEIAQLSFWLSQSASLSRDNVLGALHYWRNVKHLEAIPEDLNLAIIETHLPALTVQSLLAKHQVEKVDLLVIDTMGFHFEILKRFPFHLIKPAIIHSEYGFIPVAEQQACFQFLADQGYSLAKFAGDMIAYLHGNVRRWTITNW